MAIMIGKRKRETRRIVRSDEASSLRAAQAPDRDIFRQCFETHFEPLQEASTNGDESPGSGDDSHTLSDAASLSDWEGLSGEESIPPVEIIEHGKESTHLADDVQQSKAFMVGL